MQEARPLKFGILGAGSIGCYVGANLQHGGNQVIFNGREKIQKETSRYGFNVSDLTGKKFQIPPDKIQYFTTPEKLKDCDVIFVTVKSQGTKEAIGLVRNILKPDCIIVSFQNGVSNADSIKEILPEKVVLAGMVPYNVVQMGEGKFHSGTSGTLVLEEKPGVSDNIIRALLKSGLDAKSYKDLPGILWGKLILNLNNAINALAGIPLKEELSNSAYRKILAECQREALRLLKKAGIRPGRSGKVVPQIAPFVLCLPDFMFFRIASNMIKIDPLARSSMWEDLNKGRLTEIDYINGEIVKLGKKLFIETPINSKIIEMIRIAEKNKSGSPMLNSKEMGSRLGIHF